MSSSIPVTSPAAYRKSPYWPRHYQARRYASAVFAVIVHMFACLSVCSSQIGGLRKRLKVDVGSRIQRRTIAVFFWETLVLCCKHLYEIPMGSHLTSVNIYFLSARYRLTRNGSHGNFKFDISFHVVGVFCGLQVKGEDDGQYCKLTQARPKMCDILTKEC